KRRSLRRHIIAKHWTCPVSGCSNYTGTQAQCSTHIQTAHPDNLPQESVRPGGNKLPCRACPRTYRCEHELAEHIQVSHPRCSSWPASSCKNAYFQSMQEAE